MASITIREVDGTIYGLSSTSADNVVFVPGTAITGPDEPTLCNSYKEFTSIFGDTPPEVSNGNFGSNWEYAANLLIAGFPVLFKRITKSADNLSTATDLVSKASYALNYTPPVDEGQTTTTYEVGNVEALYGGTFGNLLSFSFVVNTASIYVRVFRKYTIGSTSYENQVESIKLVDIAASDEETVNRIKDRIGKGLKTEYITITLSDNDTSSGYIYDFIKTYVDTKMYLGTGEGNTVGSDADEELAKISAGTVFMTNSDTYSILIDKFVTDVKFITAGGYTDFSYNADPSNPDNISFVWFSDKMANIANERKDCIAILDVPYGTKKEDVQSYFFSNQLQVDTSYATAYAPWALMELESGVTGTTKWMPPSYVFLRTLAYSIKSGNKIWFPPAGVRRATVGGIVRTEYDVGQSLLDSWQNNSPQYINPIMRLRQYGYVIYGQRTLYRSVDGSTDNRSALQELGVRITANEIKRQIYDISLQLTFEQNNIHTWNEFRGLLDPFMSQLLNDGALYSYEIIMDETTTTNADIDENRIVGVVRANITRAAEDFEIGFELTSSSVTLSEF